jgi:hypothetical protein
MKRFPTDFALVNTDGPLTEEQVSELFNKKAEACGKSCSFAVWSEVNAVQIGTEKGDTLLLIGRLNGIGDWWAVEENLGLVLAGGAKYYVWREKDGLRC